MSVAEVFQRITAALHGADISYMLTGSFASSSYGAPRTTQDIDLVIEATPEQLQKLARLLPETEYYLDLDAALAAQKRHSLFNVIDQATGWKIDLIIRKDRPFSEEEFRRRRQATLEGVQIFVASAEDVVLSKLEWARLAHSNRHIVDAAGILRLRWELLDRVYLEKWTLALGLTSEWEDVRRNAGLLGQ